MCYRHWLGYKQWPIENNACAFPRLLSLWNGQADNSIRNPSIHSSGRLHFNPNFWWVWPRRNGLKSSEISGCMPHSHIHTLMWAKRAQTEMNLRCRNDCCAVAQRTRRTHTNAGYRIRTKWNKRWTTPWDCVRVCEQRNFADLPTKENCIQNWIRDCKRTVGLKQKFFFMCEK